MQEINVRDFLKSLTVNKTTFLFVSMYIKDEKRKPFNCLLSPRLLIRMGEDSFGLQTDFNSTPEFADRVNKFNKGIGVITSQFPDKIIKNEDGSYTFTRGDVVAPTLSNKLNYCTGRCS